MTQTNFSTLCWPACASRSHYFPLWLIQEQAWSPRARIACTALPSLDPARRPAPILYLPGSRRSWARFGNIRKFGKAGATGDVGKVSKGDIGKVGEIGKGREDQESRKSRDCRKGRGDRKGQEGPKRTAAPRSYLVDVELAAEEVELRVEALQHVDHHDGRGRGADGREAHDVAEEHGHVVVGLGLDLLAQPEAARDVRREDEVQQAHVLLPLLVHGLRRLHDRRLELVHAPPQPVLRQREIERCLQTESPQVREKQLERVGKHLSRTIIDARLRQTRLRECNGRFWKILSDTVFEKSSSK